jgi:hypothetical protein
MPFRHNELPRLCLNALRSAGQPMHVREITALVLTGKGRTSFHATSLAQIERGGNLGTPATRSAILVAATPTKERRPCPPTPS